MKSLKTKMVAIIISCTMLAIIIVGGLSIFTSNRIIHANSQQNLNLICETYKLKCDLKIQSLEQSVDSLSQNVRFQMDDMNAFYTDSDYVKEYTDSLLNMSRILAYNTEGCRSVYVRYNPEITESTSGLFLVYNDENGLYESVTPTDLNMYDKDDMEHVGWYYVPVENKEPTWMEPYINKNIDKTIVSYVVPIYYNSVNIGVVGMDIDFSFFKDMVESITTYSSGNAFLIDNDGHIMVHHSLPLYSKLADQENGQLNQLVEDLLDDSVTSGHYTYQGIKKDYVCTTLQNGMTLCISAPTREIYKDSTMLMNFIILIGLISFIILSFIAYGVITMIMRIANIDELTRLPNRKAFMTRFQSSVKDGSLSLFIFDIDNFKQINDRLGHNTGDLALRDLGKTIHSILGLEVNIARWGGDEFIGVLPTTSAKEHLEELRRYVEEQMHGDYGSITISIGLTQMNENMSLSEVTEKADKALYTSKSEGRNKITEL